MCEIPLMFVPRKLEIFPAVARSNSLPTMGCDWPAVQTQPTRGQCVAHEPTLMFFPPSLPIFFLIDYRQTEGLVSPRRMYVCCVPHETREKPREERRKRLPQRREGHVKFERK